MRSQVFGLHHKLRNAIGSKFENRFAAERDVNAATINSQIYG
jgi:hypothetical protein